VRHLSLTAAADKVGDGVHVGQEAQGRKRTEGLLRAGLAGAVKLNYVEVKSDKPEGACPVLILHGLLGSSRNFASFSKALSDELVIPRRIIMPDLRNHGESSHSTSMGYVNMAADIKALLEELGIDKCCVIGHSMGGKAAACLALLFPELVESIAILDIAPVSYTGQHGPRSSKTWVEIHSIIDALNTMPKVETRKDADAHLAATIDDPILRSFALTNLVPDRAEGGMKWRIGIKSIARNMGIIGGFDLGQGLQRPASDLGLKFERDAFFIQGGASSFIRSTHLPEIGLLFPRFKVQTMRNAGHWVHSEDPEATIRNVQRFLDRENPTPF